MAAKINTAPPRGTRDVLPDEVELREAATQRILAVYRSYGFRRIETPALESLALLAGSEGGENEKLIFKILKRGEDLERALAGGGDLADLGLRFDLTVPLARYYAENHAQLPDPLKAIQIGPVWRAERPQKARYRQFTQCDIDVLGTASPLVEIELILATCEALRAEFDPTLVRGMGYYTGTIFEAVMPGFSGSVAGGGRYDRMIGKLLGREVPACGFSIGFERLVGILGERGGGAMGAAAAGQPRRVALL